MIENPLFKNSNFSPLERASKIPTTVPLCMQPVEFVSNMKNVTHRWVTEVRQMPPLYGNALSFLLSGSFSPFFPTSNVRALYLRCYYDSTCFRDVNKHETVNSVRPISVYAYNLRKFFFRIFFYRFYNYNNECEAAWKKRT